jgi:trimeric autotransporter adhesin
MASQLFRVDIDLGQNQLLNCVVQGASSDPSGGTYLDGQLFYNTTSHVLKYYNGNTSAWVSLGAGSGTVTSVSVVSANGLAGTVASSTSTPAITLTTTITGLLKGNGTAISAASSGTDYAPATSGSSLLKGNGSGGFSNAVSATDYAPATTGTSILKASSGGFANAASGTDYAPATSGSSLLKANGSGGFSNAVAGDIPNIAESQVTNLTTDLAAKAALASPTFTGTPAAPTASAGTNTTQLATTAFVQAAASAAAQGLSIKDSCVAATVGTETYTVVSGSVTVINGTTLDGQSPAIGDRILVKDAPASSGTGSANSTQPGNGIYAVTNATTNLTISRTADMSGAVNLPAGAFTFIEGGTVSANAGFVVSVPSTNAAFTYGTNNIKWTQFSGAGEITAGTGITKSANTISLTTPVAAANGGAGTVSGILKANGSGTVSAATSATDYAPATTGSSILKASSGGFANAVAGTDYAAATSGSSILKGNGSGGFASGIFQGTIGNGSSTSIAVTHSLGNQYPIVQVYEVSSGNMIICDVVATSTSVSTLNFNTAPTTNQYTVTIIG